MLFRSDNLETLDFTSMSELRKIGWNAFEGDAKLKNMVGSHTYTYKQYDASTDTSSVITGCNAISEGVCDLSGLHNLRSIAGNAFKDCNSIKFLHLPDNKPNGATQSNLYIGYDPENYSHSKAGSALRQTAILSSNKSIRVLVGESALFAHYDFGKNKGSRTHYINGCFGVGNDIYYHLANSSDIPSADSESIKYWTKEGDDFILINSAKDARKYYHLS